MRLIGALVLGNADAESFRAELRDGLRKLSYVEGQNINFKFLSANGKFDLLLKLAAELGALRVDVIVARYTPCAPRGATGDARDSYCGCVRRSGPDGSGDELESPGREHHRRIPDVIRRRWSDVFRQTALFVTKTFQGGNPANMPVEQPTRFELVVNLTTAKALGITIPESFLVRADEVIE